MKREVATFVLASSLTLVSALFILRWLAPQLIGLPLDLQAVRVAEEVPPFFDCVFRREDYEGDAFIIRDPYQIRARPLAEADGRFGPNDILGFRNRAVPNDPDIIAIGDSQTYGSGVPLSANWPSTLERLLRPRSAAEIYNMSVGGWGAGEYWGIFDKALLFEPRIVIVAFYSGNDPRDTYARVYRRNMWPEFQDDPSFVGKSFPSANWPVPDSETWSARLADGGEVGFTPKLRHNSNQNHPAAVAGYRAMAAVAERMAVRAAEKGVALVFALIPTKELVFERRLAADGVTLSADYEALVRDETARRSSFVERIKAISGAVYVELLPGLQRAATQSADVYPASTNGHPAPRGHWVIASAMQPHLSRLLSERP